MVAVSSSSETLTPATKPGVEFNVAKSSKWDVIASNIREVFVFRSILYKLPDYSQESSPQGD